MLKVAVVRSQEICEGASSLPPANLEGLLTAFAVCGHTVWG
jgi:hypothetical protein